MATPVGQLVASGRHHRPDCSPGRRCLGESRRQFTMLGTCPRSTARRWMTGTEDSRKRYGLQAGIIVDADAARLAPGGVCGSSAKCESPARFWSNAIQLVRSMLGSSAAEQVSPFHGILPRCQNCPEAKTLGNGMEWNGMEWNGTSDGGWSGNGQWNGIMDWKDHGNGWNGGKEEGMEWINGNGWNGRNGIRNGRNGMEGSE